MAKPTKIKPKMSLNQFEINDFGDPYWQTLRQTAMQPIDLTWGR